MTPSDFPASKTQTAFRLGWVGRHFASAGASGAVLATVIASIAGVKLDLNPVEAITRLGLPVGLCVCLVLALGWVFVVHLPRRDSQEEERLKQIHDRQREEIEHLREVMTAEREATEKREERMMQLFETSITRIMDGVQDLKVEVRSELQRLHDRMDGLTTGPHARVPGRRT